MYAKEIETLSTVLMNHAKEFPYADELGQKWSVEVIVALAMALRVMKALPDAVGAIADLIDYVSDSAEDTPDEDDREALQAKEARLNALYSRLCGQED